MAEVFDLISAIRGEVASEHTWKQTAIAFPQQRNSYDCGVFSVCAMALILAGSRLEALGAHPWLRPDQMATRRKIAADIFATGTISVTWRAVCSRGKAEAAAVAAQAAAAAATVAAAAAASANAAATAAAAAVVACYPSSRGTLWGNGAVHS